MRIHRSPLSHLAASALLLLLPGCKSSSTSGQLPPPRLPSNIAAPIASPNSGFQVGEWLELLVEEDPSFNSTYEIREGGYILVPKVGRIPVQGLNREDAEVRIKEYLQRQQLKQATVFVERKRSGAGNAVGGVPGSAAGAAATRISVFLTGAVGRPGQHFVPLPRDGRAPGVFETVLTTGGAAKFADDTKVKIMRQDASGIRRTQVVNLRNIQEGTAPDVPIGEGDIIHIPEKVFGF